MKPYNPFPTFKETAEITYFLDKNETGKGIGKSALNHLENEAREMGIKFLLADIASTNQGSINFHKNNGFKECGRLNSIAKKKGEYFDIIYMQKNLFNNK